MSLESVFQLKKKNTTVQTEIRAGIATFLTMAYIIVVNPGILSTEGTGLPFSGVLTGTIIASAVASILMGLIANLPFALAPGMGLNAFFTFTLVFGLGLSWQTALGAVFISGVVVTILSLLKVRHMIIHAIPEVIRYAVAAGIGLFIAFIGLQWSGFVVDNGATLVGFGGINAQTLIFVFGLFLTGALVLKKVPGALIIGIAVNAVACLILSLIVPEAMGPSSLVQIPSAIFALPNFELMFKLDIVGALTVGMIVPIFTLMFTDLFDSVSTFVGVAEVGGFIDRKTGEPENVGRALIADSIGTLISGPLGTSNTTTYVESAAGVEEGGRSGLTAIVAGLMFLPFLFLSPLLDFIPQVAVAPVMIIVGLFMMKPLRSINWSNFEEGIPAFLGVILIPLTYSITTGLVWAFLSYTVIKVLVGKVREIPPFLWIIDIFAILSLALTATF
jgi:AGZA family xanthine/uracil permease-like MFS transporter